MIPFSSKSCWCLKVKDCPSLNFLTNTKDDRSKSYHCLATWKEETSLHQTCACRPPRWGTAMVLPHHFQQVLLQRFHSGEWLHLQHATRPVNQSRLTWRSLQTETQPPRQDLRSGHVHGLSLSFRRHTDHNATFWHIGIRTKLGPTCRLYKEPGVSYRCRGRRSIDSRTAISFRIKATAGRLQRTKTSSLADLYERLFLPLTCEQHHL